MRYRQDGTVGMQIRGGASKKAACKRMCVQHLRFISIKIGALSFSSFTPMSMAGVWRR